MSSRSYSNIRLKRPLQIPFQYLNRIRFQPLSCKADSNLDARARLSKIWVPTGGLAVSSAEDGQMKLIRAGFLRQSHSGIFHMLPLGCRVQEKLEALIDKHMRGLGASKLSLSSISSEELWSRTGRLEKSGSELFRFQDRKSTRFLLSPTHEEEITSLISSTVKSYKELPVRVYQISRKYRDELRPRHGLFRSREFLMKDLYTFDYSQSSALSTYHEVRTSYARLLNELKLSHLEAEADSGDIGGTLSHEFHLPTPRGEDHVLTCSDCNYVANEEVAQNIFPEKLRPNINPANDYLPITSTRVWRGISKDRSTLINVWYETLDRTDVAPELAEVSFHAVKAIIPDLDSSVDDAPSTILKNIESVTPKESPNIIQRIVNLVDFRVPISTFESIKANDHKLPIFLPCLVEFKNQIKVENMLENSSTGNLLNLLRFQNGDQCPRCVSGSLKIHKTIELGHTFHLGTRYSEPLMASLSVPLEVIKREGMTIVEDHVSQSKPSHTRKVLMQMGCHGIGVSRIIGAVADILADEKGLNWPRAIAPFEVVIIPGKGLDIGAEEVYDQFNVTADSDIQTKLDLVLDDRKQSFPWKMQDADLVGYPIIIVVGRRWKDEKVCEIQCRKLGIQEEVHIKDLNKQVISYLERL